MEYSDKTGGYPLEKERAAVAKGAALLDKLLPGWHKQVKLDKLEMGSPTMCMMGQLFGTKVEGKLAREMYPEEYKETCARIQDEEGGGDPLAGYDVAMNYNLVYNLLQKQGFGKEAMNEYLTLHHVCSGHDNRCLWAEAVAERVAHEEAPAAPRKPKVAKEVPSRAKA